MKSVADPAMKSLVEEWNWKLFFTGEDVEGWTPGIYMEEDFASDPKVLEGFTVATKLLQSTDFGQGVLVDWRDEREFIKEVEPGLTTADFVEELGYLEGFTGRNLTQLMKYYLSPRAIVDGAWSHEGCLTSDDGKYLAHFFVPLSFREHDGFLWMEEVATGKGWAVGHDEL